MKKLCNPKDLPLITAALGGVCLVLRRLMYRFAVDAKGLLVGGHPLAIAVNLGTVAALAFLVAAVWQLDGSNRYKDNFCASFPSAAGHILGAAGILLTVLLNGPMMPGYLGAFWKALGFAAPVCLTLAAFDRVRGKRPFFLLHLVPCLFLVFHIVDHYRAWSGNPQFQDYAFALFGTMALMFFAFYSTAFGVGTGRRRMHLGMGLAAVYLCLGNLARTEYVFLYLGGIAWVLTSLCSLEPKPKQPEEEA